MGRGRGDSERGDLAAEPRRAEPLASIEQVYPDLQSSDHFYAPTDYGPLLESLGYEVLLRGDDTDYRGDSRILFEGAGSELGLLQFGWGSCSGCDALQGCQSYEELDELRSEIRERIMWRSPEQLIEWCDSPARRTDYDAQKPEKQAFIVELRSRLERIVELRRWRKPNFIGRERPDPNSSTGSDGNAARILSLNPARSRPD